MSIKAISWVLFAAALVVAVIGLIRFNRAEPPEGPSPIVWDREVCAYCKMHIGDPRFAAQLQTTEGDVFNFDDPGCLFEYMDANPLSIHALYFRDYDESGWLSESGVGFLPVDDSPMGYGIRAVPEDTTGAEDIVWAKARVKERRQAADGGE
ncbi:MAG TPA: hypothetical protein VLS88_08295 [Polyangiales bacterium]|nr:hypothetical protein [Polyangiales bacterium]